MKRLLFLLVFGTFYAPAGMAQWTGRRQNLGPALNDARPQQLPQFSTGGDTLFFSTTGPDGNPEIRYSTRGAGGAWSPQARASWLLPSAHGARFLFTALPGGTLLVNGHYNRGLQSLLQSPGLAFARPQGPQTDFQSLPFTGIDTMVNSRFTGAFLYAPAKVLFLSVLRAGNEDLFVCTALNPQEGDWSHLQWSAPQKLSLNTSFAESTPWLSADGSTLYFASDRPGGLGGFDLWSAARTGAGWTEWSVPKNLGAPINSKDQERSLTVDPWSGEPYFVSDSGTLGGSDIFRLQPDTALKPPPATGSAPPDSSDNDLRAPRYKPSNIVFLLDLSNSMKIARRMTLLKTAMRPLVQALRPVDRVSLYRFGDHTERLFDVPALTDPKKLQHIVDSLRVQGEATNGSVAIQEGYREALRKLLPAGNNQIILVTDGDFPVFTDVERTILQTLTVQLTVVMIDESPEGRRLLAKFQRYPNVQIVTLTDVQKDAAALLRSVQGNARVHAR